MVSAENLFSNLLTVLILLVLFLIIYLKMTSKTLIDMIRDFREAFSGGKEEVQDSIQGGFEGIR